MTKIIIVRHGYSVTNAANRFTGQTDVALTDEGRRQAERVADYLVPREHIDAIFSSDLSRAVDTARPTAERLGLEINRDPALRELAMGVWEGMLFDDVKRFYAEDVAARKKDVYHPCPGGESTAQMFTRIKDALFRIAAENEGKTVMVVTHGGAVRIINCLASGGDVTETVKFSNCANAAISFYRFEEGALHAEEVNITSHLSDAAANANAALQ